MGEIKSTLDLVMEKTRHLALDEKEKAKLRQEEAQKRARGYAQKYLDGTWKFTHLTRALQEDESPEEAFRECAALLVSRIQPEAKDADKLLDDLLNWAGSEGRTAVHRVRQVLSDFRERETALREETSRRLLVELERKGIRGSAVVPKIQKDPLWRETHTSLLRETTARLEPVTQALLEALHRAGIPSARGTS